MNEKLNELRLDAGIARIENQQWLCVLDKETGMLIDPIIGLEKFAQLIVRECVGVVEGGRFLHDQAPTALFAKECSSAIKRHFGVEE